MRSLKLAVLIGGLLTSCSFPWGGEDFPEAYSLVVHQGEVYVSGVWKEPGTLFSGSTMRPVYWKRDQRYSLPFSEDYGGQYNRPWPQGSFSIGDDLYFWGGIFLMKDGILMRPQMYYWKNGTFHKMENISEFPLDFTVHQEKIHTLGDRNFGYWIEDQFLPLDGTGNLSSMVSEGDNFYLAGNTFQGVNRAFLWENGRTTMLPVPVGASSSPGKMVVVEDELYISGWVSFDESVAFRSADRTSPALPLAEYEVSLWKQSERLVLGKLKSRGLGLLKMVKAGNNLVILGHDDELNTHRLFTYELSTGAMGQKLRFPQEVVQDMASDGDVTYFLIGPDSQNNYRVFKDEEFLYNL